MIHFRFPVASVFSFLYSYVFYGGRHESKLAIEGLAPDPSVPHPGTSLQSRGLVRAKKDGLSPSEHVLPVTDLGFLLSFTAKIPVVAKKAGSYVSETSPCEIREFRPQTVPRQRGQPNLSGDDS